MKEKYKLLLNKTYELEGLLLMAINRDPLPQNLEALIEQKRRDIAALQLVFKPKKQEQKKEEPKPQPQPEIRRHEREEPKPQSQPEVRKPEREEPIPQQQPEVPKPQPAEPKSMPKDMYYSLEDDDENSARPPERKKTFIHRSQRRKPVFSLNDRFLFIRETFYGDASAFNRAVEGVCGFDAYQKAEDYLINEYGLDPDDETDGRFLEIVAAVFK